MKIKPEVRLFSELKPSLIFRGTLVKNTPTYIRAAICSNRCEKCAPECFFTFFKPNFWTDREPLEIGQTYEIRLKVNGEYLNLSGIKLAPVRYHNAFAGLVGFYSRTEKNEKDSLLVLTNGIKILNPNNVYDVNSIEKNKKLFFRVKLINFSNGKKYINAEGKEFESYYPRLSLYSREEKKEEPTGGVSSSI